jgi:hypothetical protein
MPRITSEGNERNGMVPESLAPSVRADHYGVVSPSQAVVSSIRKTGCNYGYYAVLSSAIKCCIAPIVTFGFPDVGM